jgi:type I restriction enzyme S subunit
MARRTKGAAVKGINLGDLKLLPVIQPSKRSQFEYKTKVEMLRTARAKSILQAFEFDALFSSLQHRAFSGEL